jgi:molecular chaperone DnaK
MGRIVGIDLGTTNSCVAIFDGKDTTVIHNRQGGRTLPSVVAIGEGGERLVGSIARRQAVMNPQRTIHGVKRLIGRKFDDLELEVWKANVPYTIAPAPNGDAWVQIDGQEFSPQEISAMILKEIKDIAEDYLGEEVSGAVITVPAYFNDNQRQATKDAGAIAGLEVKKIINEPTAAALAYGLTKESDLKLAVFDLGGGTFDITILHSSDGVFEVLSSNGDTSLGGTDFDHNLVNHLLDEFQRENDCDLRQDPCAMQRVKEEVEKAKCELSVTLTSSVNLPYIFQGPDEPLHLLHDPLERRLLESVNRELMDRLEEPCLTALKDAGLERSDIDQVILVGGMTRMPAIQLRAEQIFGKKPAKDVNPDEVVAVGAAAQCGILSGAVEDVVLLDVTPHSLGIKVIEDRMSVVIPKNTTIPTSEQKVFSTTEDNQDFVSIEVYQGEARQVRENTHLGRFTLEGLPRKKAAEVHVEVTFLIDANGVLNVSAREMQTGRETTVNIHPAGGLTREQREQITNAVSR